jgi:GT2 family glycosyltransferase
MVVAAEDEGLNATLPFVRVVVLNWNAAWLTARCVRSVQASDYPSDRIEVVVVDNGSIDGSLERLRHDLSGARFVENGANLGFAEGCNRALRDLDPVDLVALVNNDATVDPDWLRPLVDVMTTDTGIGGACPKILLETPYVDVAVPQGARPTAVVVGGVDATSRCLRHRLDEGVLGVPVLEDVDVEIHLESGAVETMRLRGDDATVRINSFGMELDAKSEGVERHLGESDRDDLQLEEVAACSGGAVVYRAAALRDVGLFDPRFFAYCEDLDLSWRLRRAGWRLVAVPTATARHLMHGAGGPGNRFFFFTYFRNWLLMVLRNGSKGEIYRAKRNALGRTWLAIRGSRDPRQRMVAVDLLRVWAGVAAGAPRVLRSRFGGDVGVAATDDVGSRWLHPPEPAPPSPRPGGPTLVYVDVTEALHSAADRHEVLQVIRDLPRRAPGIELVPVTSAPAPSGFRRVTPSEMAQLLGQSVTSVRAVDPGDLWLDAFVQPSESIGSAELVGRSEPVEAALAFLRAR